MKTKSPAFQFYPDDFIGGTCDLSAEEVGTYIRLLCYQWSRESIPVDDIPKLTRIAGSNVTLDVLRKFPDGKNAKLESVRNNLNKYKTTCVENGKKGGNPNFVKGKSNPYYREDNQNDNPIDNQKDNPRLCSKDNPTHNQEISSLTLSLTPTLTSTITPNTKLNKPTTANFNEFWSAYPRKIAKADAERAWDKIRPDIQTVLTALEWQCKTEDWTKEGVKYIPFPATYLNSRRYEDEKPAAKSIAESFIKPKQLSQYDRL